MDPLINEINQLVYRIQTLSEELEVADEIIDSLCEDLDLSEELVEAVLSEEEKKKWIQKAIKKEGSLRKSMKTKEGKNIPVSKLKAAAKKGGKMGKRARLALTLRKLNESKEMHSEMEGYLSTISRFGHELHKTNHPNRYEYAKALDAFIKGDENKTDELLSMGADPKALAGFVKITSNPEYQKYMSDIWANKDVDTRGD